MRGRYPSGPDVVWRLRGSPLACRRLHVVLKLLAGTCRMRDACAERGLRHSRLKQLRDQVLRAALDVLEPRAGGRPRQTHPVPPERLAALEERIRDLEQELKLSRAREEIAAIRPPTRAKKKTVPRSRGR
jgi:hypothetical protein